MGLPSRADRGGGARPIAASLLFAAVSGGVAFAAPVTCQTCHTREAKPLAASVHAALACQECHGGDEAYAVVDADLPRFQERAGGAEAKFDHGSSFRGKPRRGEIPERCGTCHADVERMNPYGLRTDQLAAYRTSGHGKTLFQRGDERVAVCTDCHGVHDVHPAHEATSKTHPRNVPDMCGSCHANAALMAEFDLPAGLVDEYRHSVHGDLLLQAGDLGAPTCATCHGNHSAMPPGFRTVGAVCGKCHEHASKNFETSIHAKQPAFAGCVQCHGGGPSSHQHKIERITKPTGVMIQRYAHLMSARPSATPGEVTEAIHPDPKNLLTQVLPGCLECHSEPDEDKSLAGLFKLIDDISAAERLYVGTAHRLDEVGRGVLLVDHVRFTYEDAKTHLIELAPLQHTLSNEAVAGKVAELRTVCTTVNTQLDDLERGLRWRYRALIPVWGFALVFAAALYATYRRLRAVHVQPMAGASGK